MNARNATPIQPCTARAIGAASQAGCRKSRDQRTEEVKHPQQHFEPVDTPDAGDLVRSGFASESSRPHSGPRNPDTT